MRINQKNMNNEGRTRAFFWLLALGILFLLLISFYSITQGTSFIALDDIKDAFFNTDRENAIHLIVLDLRLPRILTAILVGSALAVSGCMMQGITGNPMADSGLMGLNAGAVFMIALSLGFFPGLNYSLTMIAAFFGSLVSAVMVYGISSLFPGGNGPLKLILAGATISGLLTALSQGIAITLNLSQSLTFWTMGSVSAVKWNQLVLAGPLIAGVLIYSYLIAHKITILSMGEEIATGLGIPVRRTRGATIVVVVLLTATAVSLAGMISFVGLIIPHVLRFFIGRDYRKLILLSSIYGSLLLVISDLFSRTLNPPGEIPIGALISFLAAPFFLFLNHRRMNREVAV